jgi:cell division septation protein DedD
MVASARARRWASVRRVFWGTSIALVGFALGVVAGSVLEGPRLLLEWLRGPVRSVEVARAEPDAVEAGSLEEVSKLHRPAVRRPPALRAEPPPVAAARSPAAPAPAARAPAAQPPPDGVVAELRREVADRPPAPPAAPAAVAAPAPGTPVVQVASTPDAAEAQRIVARLRAGGFDAFSVAGRANGAPTHRVRVRSGRGQTPSALAENLKAQGFDTWITRD